MASGTPGYTRTSSGAYSPSPGTSARELVGFTARETAGAAAVAKLRSGSATGQILDEISFAANESTGDWYAPVGKRVGASDAVYLEVVSGAVTVTAFIR